MKLVLRIILPPMTLQNYFKTLLLVATCLFFLSCSSSSPSSKLVKLQFGDAITFQTTSGLAVPLDLQSESIKTVFDVGAQNNTSSATLTGKVKEKGNPYFLCDCTVTGITVNGSSVEFIRANDPDNQNNFVVIKRNSNMDENLEIKVDYAIKSSEYSFQNNGIGFLVSTSDLMDGSFFEPYGPTNYEWDQLKLDWEISIKGSSSSHQIFTNGAYTYTNDGTFQTWKISFPDYFTSSSSFLHITNRTDLNVRRFSLALKEKTIPVVVYGTSSSAVDQAAQALPGYFAELEDDYGPFAHDGYVAYMTVGGGGMEYVGGAITSMYALSHELTHSWFARGVMPSDGRSGWIDEAIASWRDYGYQRASSYNERAATNLANFSPFERFTPTNCYRDGRALLAELDFVLASQGGFKKVLRDFFAKYKYQSITTQQFTDFIEPYTSVDLRPLFTKNVYGDFLVPQTLSVGKGVTSVPTAFAKLAVKNDSKHPTPLTHEDVVRLR